MLEQRIQQHFIDSADLAYQSAQSLAAPIAAAVQAVLACITGGGKLLVCGDGAGAVLAHHFAALCVVGFERPRPALAALALSEASALHGAHPVQGLAHQVQALGLAGDVLLVLAHDAGSAVVQAAVQAAHERDMSVLALTGRQSEPLPTLLRETDVLIPVPHERAARVREMHALVLHCLCDGVDAQLLGDQEI